VRSHRGLTHDESRLVAYHDFWEPHTLIDPDVVPLLRQLKVDGLKVGVLSNTVWPRTATSLAPPRMPEPCTNSQLRKAAQTFPVQPFS